MGKRNRACHGPWLLPAVPRRDRRGRQEPGRYNVYLGAAFGNTQLNKLYRQDLGPEEIVVALRPLIESYARERTPGERFGDFLIRREYVMATQGWRDFDANIAPELAPP